MSQLTAPPDLKAAEDHLRAALSALGFAGDPEMVVTPAKVARFLSHFVPQGQAPPAELLPTRSADLIVIRDLAFQSLCAHHLLPFFGTCTIVVRPAGEITGFGWFPRLLDWHARQPQLQERLSQELCRTIHESLGAHAVGVRIRARQLCVEMRGTRAQGAFEVVSRRGGHDAEVDAVLRQPPQGR